NIPKSMMFRTLYTLESMGYLLKNDRDKTYTLGIEMLRLGKIAAENLPLPKAVTPLLQELNEITNETVCIVVTDIPLLRGVQILNIETKHPIKHNSMMTTVGYLHSGAARKIILAHMNSGYVEKVIHETGLPKVTENTITDANQLRE